MCKEVNKSNVRNLTSFFFIFCSLFTICFSLFSQTTVSPYSRYGIGELQNDGFAKSSAMGGTSIAMQPDSVAPFFINTLNPASYASLRLTTFEAGFLNNISMLQSTGVSQTINNTSLGYISFGIPFTKWWGGSFGLMPFSSVGYNTSSTGTLDSINSSINYLYQGSGGINKLYFGNGFKIKNFSFGVNASYLFGTISYLSKEVFSDPNAINIRVNQSTRVSDVYFDYGIQYSFKIDSLRERRSAKRDSLGRRIARRKRDIEDVKFTFGLIGTLQSDINATTSTLAETYRLSSNNDEIVRDTVQNTINSKGSITIPMSIGAGLSVKKGLRWLISADYLVQDWSHFSSYDQISSYGQNVELKNSMKASIGIQYIPAKRTDLQGNYWKKINYRMGFKYYQTSLQLQGTEIDEYALTFGVGLPVGRTKLMQQYWMMNVSCELGQLGTTANNLVKEQYFRVILGLTINDRWFIKSKYD
jgi:hypothetical protein